MSKSWSFTINNYTPDDEKLLNDLEVAYIVYGKEVGDSGTPHLQGFVTFRKTNRLAALKKIHPTAHWEPAKAADAAANYCMKDKNYIIRDNRAQGKRNDLDHFIEDMKTNGLQAAIESSPHTYVNYHSGLDKLSMRIIKPQLRNPPKVIWLYGDTGAGKTRYVYDHHPVEDIWSTGSDLKWFDQYTGQKVALFDDFRDKNVDFHWFLKLLDRYPVRTQTKGGHINFCPDIIYITSPRSPEHQFIGTGEDTEQLTRRITHTVHCRFGADIEIPDEV